MGIDISKIRNENQRLKSQGGGNSGFLDNFVKMPEGTGFVTVRILPPAEGFDLPYAVTRTHRLGTKNFHCLCTLGGEWWEGHCPICDYYKYLWRESDGTHDPEVKAKIVAEARSIKPVERFYYNVVVREAGGVNVGPKILSIGKQLHRLITIGMCGDPEDPNDPGYGDITDIQTGRDFKIKKTITKGSDSMYPSYNESKFLDKVTPAGTAAEIANWLSGLHDLGALRQTKVADELRREIRIFRGLEKDPASSFDREDFAATPTVSVAVASKPTSTTATKPATKPVDVDLNSGDESLLEEDYLKELRNM